MQNYVNIHLLMLKVPYENQIFFFESQVECEYNCLLCKLIPNGHIELTEIYRFTLKIFKKHTHISLILS